jgi:hypothetical protein
MGAPVGNKNAAKAKLFYDALRRVMARDDWKLLHAAAEKLGQAAADGEPWAIQEVANRFDGKPAQSVTVAGDEDAPMKLVFGWKKD